MKKDAPAFSFLAAGLAAFLGLGSSFSSSSSSSSSSCSTMVGALGVGALAGVGALSAGVDALAGVFFEPSARGVEVKVSGGK